MSDIERLLQTYYGDPDRLKSPDVWGRDETAWGSVDRTLSDIFGPINRRLEPVLGPKHDGDWRRTALDVLNAATLMGPGRGGPPRLPPRGHTVLPGEGGNVVAHPGHERMASQGDMSRPADVIPFRSSSEPSPVPAMPERPMTTADVLPYVAREAPSVAGERAAGTRAEIASLGADIPRDNAWPFFERQLRDALARGDARAADIAFDPLVAAMSDKAAVSQLQGNHMPPAMRQGATLRMSEALDSLGPEFHEATRKRHGALPYEFERSREPGIGIGETETGPRVSVPHGLSAEAIARGLRNARENGLLSLTVPAGIAVSDILSRYDGR